MGFTSKCWWYSFYRKIICLFPLLGGIGKNTQIGELYESIEEMRQTYDNKVDAVSSKHTQEMADQKAYFEKEIAVLKEQLRS